ncbi:hypothetical protein RZS08_37095, partial [Arthrospira platensis SPKY1]|nr:hypothetical protein [Arthrospira platensis SPKY1]
MPLRVGCNEVLGLTDERFPRQRATLPQTAPAWLFSPPQPRASSKGTAPLLRRERQTDSPAAFREQSLLAAKRKEPLDRRAGKGHSRNARQVRTQREA